MKYVFLVLILAGAGYFAFKPKPAPPPPPPPAAPPPPPPPVISPEQQAKIIQTADDTNPSVRWEAILLLNKLKAPAALSVMFDKMASDTDKDMRVKIIDLLAARPPDPEVTKNIANALRDAEPDVRIAAIQALGKIGDPSTAGAILEATKDSEESVRVQALRSLNALQDIRDGRAPAQAPAAPASPQDMMQEALKMQREAMEQAKKRQEQVEKAMREAEEGPQ